MIYLNNKDLYQIMTDSTAPEKTIIERLYRYIEISKKKIDNGTVTPIGVMRFTARMRRQLIALYGEESDIPKCISPRNMDKVPTENAAEILADRMETLNCFLEQIQSAGFSTFCEKAGSRVFIGHGRSPLWRELKDFISDRLELAWDEFNREAVAGLPTFERISIMLNSSKFAFLIMTAEDEHSDNSTHARQNVVHELGLFQGHLGPKKAIILLEEGCEEFSNIVGLSQIRFPRGDIGARFEEIRRVLEREKII